MKKEKHSDISSRKKSNQKTIDSYDYLSNAASAQDCTGLIPVGPTNRAELESYEEVEHFLRFLRNAERGICRTRRDSSE